MNGEKFSEFFFRQDGGGENQTEQAAAQKRHRPEYVNQD